MISLMIAALLQAATPDIAAAKGDGLPEDDYERVAWCHGALAAQLELDPIVRADMEKIEGKAKVAARARDDAEIQKERRQYLKDYERALSAAEKASPTMIHPRGVAAEQQGYRFWAPTRAKEPIWRMLDWGMWDANDAGCGEAAKRLLAKSQLFGAALKNDDKAEAVPAQPGPAADGEPVKTAVAEAATEPMPEAPATPPAAAANAEPAATTAAAAATEPAPDAPPPSPAEPAVAAAEVKPPAPAPTARLGTAAKPATAPKKGAAPPKPTAAPRTVAAAPRPRPKAPAKVNEAEAIRAAIANGKAELEKPAETPQSATPPLRGPQQP